MVGLREQKKIAVRAKILEISKKAFLENGYENTSTKEIAKKAEIGAGTIFNYFPTKADILLEVLFNELNDEVQNNDFITAHDMPAVDVIYEYLYKTISPVLSMPSKLLREFGIAFLTLTKKRNLIQKAIKADMATINNLENIIEKLKETKLIDSKKETRRLARIIYSELFFDMMLYIFENDFSKQELQQNLKDSIKFMVQ